MKTENGKTITDYKLSFRGLTRLVEDMSQSIEDISYFLMNPQSASIRMIHSVVGFFVLGKFYISNARLFSFHKDFLQLFIILFVLESRSTVLLKVIFICGITYFYGLVTGII